MKNETSVLIAGGGLTGLTAALLLAKRGVGCIVVERHPDTSIQYKFAGISPRSMEIYREAGIEQEIRSRMTRDQKAGGIARLRNMADPQINWDRMSAYPDTSDISPVTSATLDQDQLEPILRKHAESFGADVRFHTELLSFEETKNRIRARVRDDSSHREQDNRGRVPAGDGRRKRHGSRSARHPAAWSRCSATLDQHHLRSPT